MHLIADAAATLGGRFNLIFDPHERTLYQNAYGRFPELPLDLTIGIKTPEGGLWTLPFTKRGEPFPFIEQSTSLTSLEYRGVHPGLGVEMVVRVRAPFYPRNVGLSTAPCYYVDMGVRRLAKFRWEKIENPLDQGEIIFELAGEGVEFSRAARGFRYVFGSTTYARGDAPTVTAPVASWVESSESELFGNGGFRSKFDLTAEPTARMNLVWSTWSDDDVLSVFDESTAFKYKQLFDSREEMVSWAVDEKARIEKRCEVLDRAVRGWDLGDSAAKMAALALHSFLVNTWWTVRRDGRDWFSVWEGACYYHSTIDVEYNDALLYFALWPELLGMLLDEWGEFEKDGIETLGAAGKGTGFLCHDMGSGYLVGSQAYPHNMEVEENVNYLVLLAAWTAFTGRIEEARKKLPLCRRLASFIVEADTNGNGVPDLGMANTIDDASPAVQFGREQIYLAVKSQAALWMLAEVEQKCGVKDSQAERWRAWAAKGIKTVEEDAWLDDHYVVCLSRSTQGLVDPWTGEPLPSGELKGWKDCSLHTANGLLYPFLCGMTLPRWKLNRFAADIENARRETLGNYGCRHSSGADSIVWFSANMWRDYVAAYLGIDLLNGIERYWDYQLTTGDNWRSSLYYDSTERNNLTFYPRGATVFGMPMSAAGLRLNRLDGELTLAPLRATLSVPLLPLADWEQMRIPVLTVRHREGVAVARISERDLLEGLALTVIGAELEPD